MLIPRRLQRGVSMIELMIGLAVVAVLFALGVPSFKSFIQNSKIRNAAEAIQNGLSLARSEAVRRNTNVLFGLSTGSAWSVCVTPNAADCGEVIQSRSTEEGSTSAEVATSEQVASSGAAAGSAVFTSSLVFNGLGRVPATSLAAGNNAVFDISNSSGGACATTSTRGTAPMHCLRIVVSSAGQIRMCSTALASTDPQGC